MLTALFRVTRFVARLHAVTLSSLAALFLLSFSPALAGTCGDRIDGVRVACSCGDYVVTDTRLAAGDPVVSTRCPLDGLLLSAPAGAESLTLDLNGLTLHGDPYGVGIRVESGGADGARILGAGNGRSRATIFGFATGIESTAGSLAYLESVEVLGARRDGLDLRGRGLVLVDVTTRNHGGDGLRLAGSGGRLCRVQSDDNRGNGIVLLAEQVSVEAAAERNGGHGMVVRALRTSLVDARAFDNAGAGVVAPRPRRDTDRDQVMSDGNGRPDLRFRRGDEGTSR